METYLPSVFCSLSTGFKWLCIFITILLTVSFASAQNPYLLKDINPTGQQNGPVGFNSSAPGGGQKVYTANGYYFFLANDGVHGTELWRSDGTASGTFMLKDIIAGNTTNILYENFYQAGNLLYFSTFSLDGSGHPYKVNALWRTDGTTTGTYQILDFTRGGHFFNFSSGWDGSDNAPNYSTQLGNYHYFVVTDTLANLNSYPNIHDRIYKTDGTINGTTVYFDAGNRDVSSASTGPYGNISHIIAMGSNLYITSLNNVGYSNLGARYRTLMKGDGVSQPVNIYTTNGNNGVNPDRLVNVNNNYLLLTGDVTGNGTTGLYRLKPNETTPVFLDGGHADQGGGSNGFIDKDQMAGSVYFYTTGSNFTKMATNGEPLGTFPLTATLNTPSDYLGIANNRMSLYGPDNKLYFWDGLSATSAVVASDSLTYSIGNAKRTNRVIQSGNNIFYLGSYCRISDLNGANCLELYGSQWQLGRGAIQNSKYLDFGLSFDGSFSEGGEPMILNTVFKLFTGNVSNDWNNAANWSPNGVPAATDDVYIPPLASIKTPVISATSMCNNFFISEANLIINASANLNIYGCVANFRSVVKGDGSITFKGSSPKIYGKSISTSNGSYSNFYISTININGADLSFATPGMDFASVLNFQTDNKILAQNTILMFKKVPFITGFNSNRFIVSNKSVTYWGVYPATGLNSATSKDSSFTMPIGSTPLSYTPIKLNIPSNPYGNDVYMTATISDSAYTASSPTKSLISNAVNKTWTISQLNNKSKITIGWSKNDELPGFTRNMCAVSGSDGSGTSAPVFGSTQNAVSNNGLYTVSLTGSNFLSNPKFTISNKPLSSTATLNSLVLSAGTLSPVFASSTLNYTVTVPNLMGTVTITPALTDTTARLTVNGMAVTSGTASKPIIIIVGSNIITIKSTAQDGITVQTYTITITRQPSAISTLSNLTLSTGILSPAFASSTSNYTATVANSVNNITISPSLTDTTARLTVNGLAVVNGSTSKAIALNVGNNTISVRATAQDGTTVQTYTVTITRQPSAISTVSNLTLSAGTLSPIFASSTSNYTATVPNSINNITITPALTDTTARLTINGAAVASGTVSKAITLNVGSNTINIKTTAQDGTTTQIYVVIITRSPSSISTLSGLTFSAGNLSPVFASSTLSYTATVPNSVNTVTVTPVLTDTTARLTINGSSVASGQPSQNTSLPVGNNVFTIYVTAQDGITKQTYTLNIKRDLPSRLIAFAQVSPKTYGDGDFDPGATLSSGETPLYKSSNTAIATIINGKIHILSSGSVSIMATAPVNASYKDTVSILQILTINKALLTITAVDQTKKYGLDNPAFNVSYSGFLNNDTPDSLTIKPTVSTSATKTSASGIYDLMPSGAVSINYSFNYINGKLTIALTPDNFKISLTSATCKGANNGIITITPLQHLNYTAVITGNGLNSTLNFSASDLVINNLAPATYNVCITTAGINGTQCQDVVITEPKDLSAYAVVNKQTNSITLNLGGASTYNIAVNGVKYSTTANSISLSLANGSNKILISTDKPCQGTIEQLINTTENKLPFPNPFTNVLYINLGSENLNTCTLNIFSFSDGLLKVSKNYSNISGVVQLDMTDLTSGFYVLHIKSNNKDTAYKIIKQ